MHQRHLIDRRYCAVLTPMPVGATKLRPASTAHSDNHQSERLHLGTRPDLLALRATMQSSDTGSHRTIPVLLLKTKSTPGDSYQELLSTAHRGATHDLAFEPHFVPVLLHRFDDNGTGRLQGLLERRSIGSSPGCDYGGLIFTSQRAVEAFAQVVQDGRGRDSSWPHLQDVPIYSVGPATTRALRAVVQEPRLQIFGEHTGNGEALAHFMMQHYGEWYRDRPTRPPLLFLVGEQRRDIIARTLMDPSLPAADRIRVDEEVVYGTGVMESFPEDFARMLSATHDAPSRWVVVFSPTGCDSMLRCLGMLDEATGKARHVREDTGTYIATIGPTTRTHLIESFGFEPHVCAETPSPEGVLQGIVEFESRRQQSAG
ncbi:Uroporphyrinogen-III synthase [Purpureocillium takamizusanense]|uniref:Uroporphyrinogen-III synthase n=1 Tax=Purpureocillium takamizusanense TaxID=2060973 RepID=A0A9Q8QEC7_9HYPO|nr:Uroporphyrinogen-III synthase [Purpureocillium takamizusanense]UNI17356.1 Uroporphyrinogen-III synthase [Purpureocillium takamizusanense]